MIDKIINPILDLKYLEKLVNTLSKATHYLVVLGLVYLVCGSIAPFAVINLKIQEHYPLIMLLLYIYISSSLLDSLDRKHQYGILIIAMLSFKLIMNDFSSLHIMFYVVWLRFIIMMFEVVKTLKFSFLDKIPAAVADQVKEYMYYISVSIISFITAYFVSISMTPTIVIIETWIFKTMNFIPLYFFFILMMQILWSKGIHGDQTVGRVIDSFLFIMVWINFENMVLSISQSYTINASFHLVYALGTGSGMTGTLLLALKIFNKEDVKGISEGSLYSINEPVIWGLPIVSNKKYTTPFIIAPLLSISFAWFMTFIGFAKNLTYPIFWGTPPLLRSFLGSGGHLPTVLVELLSYVIAFSVYAIFVIKSKKKGDA